MTVICRLQWPALPAACLLLALAAPLHGQRLEKELRGSIERMQVAGNLRLGGVTVAASEELATVYERRGFAPVWQDPGRRALLRVALARMADDGLNPAHYHLATLEALGALGAPEWSAAADLVHTHALLLAALHLRHGRLDAATLRLRQLADDPGTPADRAALALRLVALSPTEALEQVRPRHAVYAGLVVALRQLRQAERAGGWEPVTGLMRRDSAGPAVATLRRRLATSGDLGAGVDTLSEVFDRALEDAVRAFQQRHSLNADGVVGAATLRELNVSAPARASQVRANLERARWLLQGLPDTFLAVNVAGAVVYLIRSGELVHETRAIVGRDATRTPGFRATLSHIDLNPTWTVPPGIAGEVLAHATRDPAYLTRNRIEVLDAAGRPVPLAEFHPERYTAGSFPFVFRQAPGPLNPLGQVRFNLPNRHHVYLHDTPARELFSREDRTLSHGCVRVQDPLRLAELVLDDPAWTADRLAEAIVTGRSRSIALRSPLPVLILYWTASADRRGPIRFHRDVYGRDVPLLDALDG
jgi:L,D-transpeptidase YcbB